MRALSGVFAFRKPGGLRMGRLIVSLVVLSTGCLFNDDFDKFHPAGGGGSGGSGGSGGAGGAGGSGGTDGGGCGGLGQACCPTSPACQGGVCNTSTGHCESCGGL